jgi:hypothetical protein
MSIVPFHSSEHVGRRKQLADDLARALGAYFAEMFAVNLEALLLELIEPPPDQPGKRSHSPDFRAVSWDGRTYQLTPMQAAVVRMLWEAWGAGAPDVGQRTLLVAADSCADRLRDVFRHCQAWGTLVVPGGSKGTYRLARADMPADTLADVGTVGGIPGETSNGRHN